MHAGKLGSKIPLGRHEWNVYDTSCVEDGMHIKSLALSICYFGEEFTCDSGECIDIFKRCNKKRDCNDGSDEQDCPIIRTFLEYDKSTPPKLLKENKPRSNPIYTQVKLLNIDFINTVTMSVGLTVEINLKWRDAKLIFENILNGDEKPEPFVVVSEKE